METEAHRAIRGKIVNSPGAFVHEIGGTDNHVHVVVSVAPTLLLSDGIGQLKGFSSHETNQKFGSKILQWQAGYGIVSFGTKDLDWVKAYVRNQREHHARGTVHERLEWFVREEDMAEAEAEQREAP